MENNLKNFFIVVSSAINNKDFELIEPVDYEAILSLAEKQQIYPLIFEKLCEHENFKKSSVFNNNVNNVLMCVIGQTQRAAIFLDLYKKFQIKGISPIVVKGVICRTLYGKYEDHRPSSDEDIIVQREDFFSVCDILKENGYEADHEITEAQLDKLQAISFYSESGSHIEVHYNPIGCENEIKSAMDSYFHDIFNDAVDYECHGQVIKTMEYTKNFLFLIFHAFKHFIGSGFGIRQLLDILVFEREYEEKIDWDYIKAALEDTNTSRFFYDIVAIGNEYMGFSLPVHGKTCCPDELLNDLLNNGIFGNDTADKLMAGTMTSIAIENTLAGNNSKNFFRVVFPSKKYMQTRNPEIIEKPWLLPIKVVERWFTFIKKYKKSNGTVASQSVAIGNRRIALLKKYGIVK